MNRLWKLLAGLRALLKVLGATALMGMTLLTCADVVGRYLGYPIFGAVEIVGFLATLAVALALPYAHEMKSHIGVEILVQKFPPRTRAMIDLITGAVAILFFAIVTWRMLVYGFTFKASGEVSMNLEFPEYTIICFTAFCFLVFALTICEELAATFKLLRDKK